MITVLGSINMDLIAMVERLPTAGETVAGTDFSTAAGGKGANQALAAQRAGSDVRMCGAVGNDEFSNSALAFLSLAGADLSGVDHVDGPTGTALIMVDVDGENIISVVPGANGSVSDHQAQETVRQMERGDHLLLQLEIPSAAISAALDAARSAGVVSMLNIAPLTAEAASLAARADIVIANETEFELLARRTLTDNADRERELLSLHGKTGQTLIVTLGADGVMAARDGSLVQARGLTIEPKDTVGAGDTFCGYLASGLDAGMAFDDALKRAAVAGSLACLKTGAQPAIPEASEVQASLS